MPINLPERRHFNEGGYDIDEVLAWNACIDEVKRLNPPVPAEVDATDTDAWYCEVHPERLMGHDGCKGAGIQESCRIHMLLNKLRLAEQETRETAMVRDDLAAQLRLVIGPAWDASFIKQPGWHHVEAAFIEGAREARANPEATEDDFRRAADGHTKRVFEEVDPVSEAALRTESWKGNAEAVVLAIAGHIDGWRSATFAWQGNPDPAIEARNKATAIQGHAAECIRRIRTALSHGVMVSHSPEAISQQAMYESPLPAPGVMVDAQALFPTTTELWDVARYHGLSRSFPLDKQGPQLRAVIEHFMQKVATHGVTVGRQPDGYVSTQGGMVISPAQYERTSDKAAWRAFVFADGVPARGGQVNQTGGTDGTTTQ